MTITVNGKNIEMFLFSGGECQVKILPADISVKTNIIANLYNSNDIMSLLLTVDAVKRANPQTSIELTIPYFPYARQDRVCNEGEALSVRVMADLINNLKCSKVIIIDPHSDVTPALLNNVITVSLADIIAQSSIAKFIKNNNLTLLSPDAGAEKKVRAVAKTLATAGINADFLAASKSRDTKTGNITATHIHGDVRGKNFIILDDICDGGRTFIELAKLLKAQGAGDIYLYVTHGIFSQGLEPLKENFKHVYCYHTMLTEEKTDKNFLTIIGE
jgi:ribose-phosphate pyrophosphokinase